MKRLRHSIMAIAFAIITLSAFGTQTFLTGPVTGDTIYWGGFASWYNPTNSNLSCGVAIRVYDVTGMTNVNLNELTPVAYMGGAIEVFGTSNTFTVGAFEQADVLSDMGMEFGSIGANFFVIPGHSYVVEVTWFEGTPSWPSDYNWDFSGQGIFVDSILSLSPSYAVLSAYDGHFSINQDFYW